MTNVADASVHNISAPTRERARLLELVGIDGGEEDAVPAAASVAE
jgi:hypothetical protein